MEQEEKKGVKRNQFTKENAREMQRRGVEVRRKNTERRKALREILIETLSQPISENSEVTKLEWLIYQAIKNIKNDVDLTDLLKLQELMGEKEMTYNFEKKKPSEIAVEIIKEINA